jgi:hypothetical protein
MATRSKHVARAAAAALVLGGAAVVGVIVAREDTTTTYTPDIVQPADAYEYRYLQDWAAKQPRVKQSADTLAFQLGAKSPGMQKSFGSADAAEQWLTGS